MSSQFIIVGELDNEVLTRTNTNEKNKINFNQQLKNKLN